MPEDRKLAFFASEAEKVKHNSVDHSVRQGILLVQDYSDQEKMVKEKGKRRERVLSLG